MDFTVKFCRFYNTLHLEYGEQPPFIYDYTSSGATQSIISKDQIRFTDCYYLNDASEGRYVLDLCSDNIKTLLPDIFFRKHIEKEITKKRKNTER